MAKAYKCDRCGVLYEPYVRTCEHRYGKTDLYLRNSMGHEYDICSKCQIQLVEFMNNSSSGEKFSCLTCKFGSSAPKGYCGKCVKGSGWEPIDVECKAEYVSNNKEDSANAQS